MFRKALTLVAIAASVLGIAACSEKLEAGRSCPLLCPEQASTLRDTTLDAIEEDTTVLGLPAIGTEPFLMLSSHGDTLESRAILRYDTLPQSYTKGSIDSTIVNIDSAFLLAPILKPDSLKRPKAPVTIEAYDVDTILADSTAIDTVTADIAPLFRISRLIGSKTFAPESLLDTLRIPISTDTVLDRVRTGHRLRIGLRVRSTAGVDLRVGTTQSGLPVRLQFKASTDSAAQPVTVTPFSLTPRDQSFLSGPIADYTAVLKGQTPVSPNLLSVGGVPSRRVFLRFNVPSRLVDSTTIVRASLLLTQTPNRRVNRTDSSFVYPLAILSQGVVSNVANALGFLGPGGQFGLDSLAMAPGDSGVRSFQIVGIVRTWKGQATTVSPRTLGLRSGSEGQLPGEIDFFSTRGPLAVRPRLRITYVPLTSSGLP